MSLATLWVAELRKRGAGGDDDENHAWELSPLREALRYTGGESLGRAPQVPVSQRRLRGHLDQGPAR